MPDRISLILFETLGFFYSPSSVQPASDWWHSRHHSSQQPGGRSHRCPDAPWGHAVRQGMLMSHTDLFCVMRFVQEIIIKTQGAIKCISHSQECTFNVIVLSDTSQALFNRLVPSVNGIRRFSPIQISRLHVSINTALPKSLYQKKMFGHCYKKELHSSTGPQWAFLKTFLLPDL